MELYSPVNIWTWKVFPLKTSALELPRPQKDSHNWCSFSAESLLRINDTSILQRYITHYISFEIHEKHDVFLFQYLNNHIWCFLLQHLRISHLMLLYTFVSKK